MSDRVRIGKWLWMVRIFKTRSLAAKAVEGGKVRLNGEPVRPSMKRNSVDLLRAA